MGESGSYTAAYPELLAVATHRARRVLDDEAEAAEVAQEALLRAFVSWDDIGSFAPQWVSRVAVNLAVSRLRQRRQVWPDSLAIPEGQAGVDAQIDLGRAIAALPLRQRQVVVLRHVADLAEREVAEMLGISAGSVKRHLHRALATLRSPASHLAAAYSATNVSKEELMVTPWRTRHEPAAEPAGGWPTRPWDHRYLEDEESAVRVAVDQSGCVVLDAEGDEVQSGPGFDHEVAKVRRGRAVPHDDTTDLPVDRLSPPMLEILDRAARMGEVFGHSWVGTEHLGLALVEGSPEARDIVGCSWAALARAVAESYEGPYAAARIDVVTKRLAAGWVPTPLEAEVTPAPNGALRQLLQIACEQATSEGRPQVTLLDVAHQVIAPRPIDWPDSTRRTIPSQVRRLLDQTGSP